MEIKSFAKCSMIQLQPAELCSLEANVDTTLVLYTLNTDLQFIIDTTNLGTILHNILNILKFNLKV